MKIQSPVYLLLLCFFLPVMTGCDRGTQHVGTYIAEIEDSTHHHEIILELKETGAGLWRVGDDEVDFSWYVKDGGLRLHTRNGGVIVGSLNNKVIHITLPGSRELLFKKVE